MDDGGTWITLLSGGKDSSWAAYHALEEGLPLTQALTARPSGDSYLFHVPAIQLTPLIAKSMDLPIETFPIENPRTDDATTEGDVELDALRTAIGRIATGSNDIAGIVTGAVASQYQYERLEQLCAEFELDQFAPLWHCDPEPTLERMIDAGFDIRVVGVAAAGLDRSWLGRRVDKPALADLRELRDRYGIHMMGEGGEYETIVVDGPHMDVPVEFDAEKDWDGTRGQLRITDAWLDT